MTQLNCGSIISAAPLVKAGVTTYFAGILEVRMERPNVERGITTEGAEGEEQGKEGGKKDRAKH